MYNPRSNAKFISFRIINIILTKSYNNNSNKHLFMADFTVYETSVQKKKINNNYKST